MKNSDIIVPSIYNLSGNIRKIIKNYSDFGVYYNPKYISMLVWLIKTCYFSQFQRILNAQKNSFGLPFSILISLLHKIQNISFCRIFFQLYENLLYLFNLFIQKKVFSCLFIFFEYLTQSFRIQKTCFYRSFVYKSFTIDLRIFKSNFELLTFFLIFFIKSWPFFSDF
jgi:hypothetical protein